MDLKQQRAEITAGKRELEVEYGMGSEGSCCRNREHHDVRTGQIQLKKKPTPLGERTKHYGNVRAWAYPGIK